MNVNEIDKERQSVAICHLVNLSCSEQPKLTSIKQNEMFTICTFNF